MKESHNILDALCPNRHFVIYTRNKNKLNTITCHEGTQVERMYSSTFNLGARWGLGGQRHAPAALPPGKTRYPLHSRLGGPQGAGLDG